MYLAAVVAGQGRYMMGLPDCRTNLFGRVISWLNFSSQRPNGASQ
ncbi:hypothetical protein ACMYR2_3561 [Nitrobacter sp. TKz-YC01]